MQLLKPGTKTEAGHALLPPALKSCPACNLPTFVSLSGWFWFKGSKLAQSQIRAFSWASMKHAHESALRGGWSNRHTEHGTGGRCCDGGVGVVPGVTHILASSLPLQIFPEKFGYNHSIPQTIDWFHDAYKD